MPQSLPHRTKLVAVDASTLLPSRRDLSDFLASAPFASGGILKTTDGESSCLLSVSSREERVLDDESLVDTFAWAREEIMAAAESNLDVVVLDELGPETLVQEGLDAALRALLWRLEEGWDNAPLLIGVFDPSVLDSVGESYKLTLYDTVIIADFASLQLMVNEWWSKQTRRRHHATLKTQVVPPPISDHTTGPTYVLVRFPLLIGLMCIVGLEVLLYSALLQVVNVFEYATRANARLRHDMESATHLETWRRYARRLDNMERRHSATLPVGSLAAGFEKKLKNALETFSPNAVCTREESEVVRALREVTAPDAFRMCFPYELYGHSATGTNSSLTRLSKEIVQAVKLVARSPGSSLLPPASPPSAAAHASAMKRSMSSLTALARMGGLSAEGSVHNGHGNLVSDAGRQASSTSMGSHDESNLPPTHRSPSLSSLHHPSGSPKMLRQVSYSFLDGPMLGMGDDPEIMQEDAKRILLVEMARSFGATALCLSGGAANSYYHIGVIKALLERGILPKHISGASGGSMVAAFLCTHTDSELARVLSRPDLLCRLFNPIGNRTWLDLVWSLVRTGCVFDIKEWEEKLKNNVCGDLTFEEAYLRTGRSLTITVFNGDRHTRALNHKTAPDILIYSAVLASSAIPKLLPAVTLMRKLKTGTVEPFLTWGETWRDGSFEQEIPLHALSVVFGCSIFIVSQVNPHIVPFFFDSSHSVATHSHGRSFIAAFAERALKADMRKWLQLVDEFHLLPKLFGTDFSRVFLGVNYGDVTILPPVRPYDYLNLASDPSVKRMKQYVLTGEQMTWPKLGWIEDRMRIELALKAELKTLVNTIATKARAALNGGERSLKIRPSESFTANGRHE